MKKSAKKNNAAVPPMSKEEQAQMVARFLRGSEATFSPERQNKACVFVEMLSKEDVELANMVVAALATL